MWNSHEWILEGELLMDPKVNTSTYGSSAFILLKIKTPNIGTAIANTSQTTVISGNYKCGKPNSYTLPNGLPKFMVKGAKLLCTGKIDGKETIEGDLTTLAYNITFSEVVSIDKVSHNFNQVTGRAQIVKASNIQGQPFLLVKEQKKKINPSDPVKYRYSRIIITEPNANPAMFTPNSYITYSGVITKDVLPIPTSVAEDLKLDPKSKSRFASCFSPIIAANVFWI